MRSANRFTRFAAGALLFAAGCATAAPNPFAGPGERVTGTIRVMVQNESNYQAVVYAVWGSQSRELTTVPGRSTVQVPLDLPDTGSLRFRLKPVAALERTTNTVLVRSGDIVDLVITPDPSRSFARVR